MVKKEEFTAEDFVKVDFDERIELVKFYDSKTTANLLRLITVSLAIIGFQSGELIEVFGPQSPILHSIILAIMLATFLTAMFYFLGRALYWSYISTALCSVRSMSESYINNNYPGWEGETSKYQYSYMTGLLVAAKYECSHSKYIFRRCVYKIFNQYNRLIVCLIFFSFTLLMILLIQCAFSKLY